ncbi:MAG TPA: hypothetical protein VMS35_08420 [Nitrososphaeraceae archaeon]|nr:hypothetical protein [Nitrososphaeraceae archaeon]
MYFVNWERDIEKIKIGQKVFVIKKNKRFKTIREFILIFIFTVISLISCHPSSPPPIGKKKIENEGFKNREKLELIGIKTPRLISISSQEIIEEYIEYGNLYEYLVKHDDIAIASKAGIMTGILHNSGYTFIDNKSQNFLVSKDKDLIRIDLGLMQSNISLFAKSMDIGTFLGSVLDLESKKYHEVEREYLNGYIKTTGSVIPYLSVILRNVLSLGFVNNHNKMMKNMTKKYNS